MSVDKVEVLKKIKGKLIVSCQAEKKEPLGSPVILSAMAKSAVLGGAAAIRANHPRNIKSIQKSVNVPVIGIYKKKYSDSEIIISPTLKENIAVAKTEVEIIAMDATNRRRPHGETLMNIFSELRIQSDSILMADISCYEEGIKAEEMGFDIVSTTLSGYTAYTAKYLDQYRPNLELIAKLSTTLKIPVIAEGRIWDPQDAINSLEAGAFAVVIGSAITRPHLITKRFVESISSFSD